jgi:hypothetical protein
MRSECSNITPAARATGRMVQLSKSRVKFDAANLTVSKFKDRRTFRLGALYWAALSGGPPQDERGDTCGLVLPVFTAKPVLSCHHRCWWSALPPDVPLRVRLARRRLPGFGLQPATPRSLHSNPRSAPGKWRFGFLSLYRVIYIVHCFTGLRREYSNNSAIVNQYPGT